MERRTKEIKAKTLPSLPEELIRYILLRLPTECIIQCKFVSKHWNSLISDPSFIEAHLNLPNPTTKLILSSGSLYTADQFTQVAKKLDFEKTDGPKSYGIWGSCNGLLLVEKNYGSLDHCHFLVNPATREFKKLPESPFVLKRPPTQCEAQSMYGFGYASSEDDYKVVKIYAYGISQNFVQKKISMYSLKSNSWKKLPGSLYDFSFRGAFPGVFCNGTLHWLALGLVDCKPFYYKKGLIACIHLDNEVFNDFPIPHLSSEDLQSCEIGVLRGFLYIFISRYDGSYLDCYRMNEYGVHESWTKNFRIDIIHLFFLVPLDFTTEGIILLWSDEGLIWYNLKENTHEYLVIEGLPTQFRYPVTYVESLVPPRSVNEIRRQL